MSLLDNFWINKVIFGAPIQLTASIDRSHHVEYAGTLDPVGYHPPCGIISHVRPTAVSRFYECSRRSSWVWPRDTLRTVWDTYGYSGAFCVRFFFLLNFLTFCTFFNAINTFNIVEVLTLYFSMLKMKKNLKPTNKNIIHLFINIFTISFCTVFYFIGQCVYIFVWHFYLFFLILYCP